MSQIVTCRNALVQEFGQDTFNFNDEFASLYKHRDGTYSVVWSQNPVPGVKGKVKEISSFDSLKNIKFHVKSLNMYGPEYDGLEHTTEEEYQGGQHVKSRP